MSKTSFKPEAIPALQQRDLGLLKQTTPIASYPNARDEKLPRFIPATAPKK